MRGNVALFCLFLFVFVFVFFVLKIAATLCKILRTDPETKHIFSLPQLVSFKGDKILGNFLVRSAFKSDNQTTTFTCKRTRFKTCPLFQTQLRS